MESLGNQFPGGNLTVPKPVFRDPRRAIRQKVHTPAYASLHGSSDSAILDLCEILDISERGALLQTPKGWELGSALDLLLDFSETQTKLRTRGEVVWTDAGGRVGVRFPDLTEDARRQLQEWLFLNMMVAAANHAVGVVPRPALTPSPELESPPIAVSEVILEEEEIEAPLEMAAAAIAPIEIPAESADDQILETEAAIESETAPEVEIEPEPLVRSDYTTTLSVLAAVQREVEGLGAHPEAAMQLVAERARSLTRAAGAAVAVEQDSAIVCIGSSGAAPPVGVPIDRSAGISGRCVKTGLLQRCEDAEHDTRVDRESCRELGIRSILAVPVRMGGRVTGLVEVFSPESHAFGDFEASILQRLSETVQAVLNRRSRAPSTSAASSSTYRENAEQPEGSSSEPAETIFQTNFAPPAADADMGFLRKHLMVLVSFAVLIFVVMVYMLAVRLGKHPHANSAPSVQSSAAQASPTAPSPATQAPTIEELRQRAQQGEPYSQFSLGSRYATGEDETQDYAIAARWFLKAAEQGMVLAQDTLGAYYWAGRGVSKDVVKAYYWSSVAKLAGNQASQVRVQFLTPQLTREQAAAIQRQAADFYQKHPPLPNENPH